MCDLDCKLQKTYVNKKDLFSMYSSGEWFTTFKWKLNRCTVAVNCKLCNKHDKA